jgi:hypothetical protein
MTEERSKPTASPAPRACGEEVWRLEYEAQTATCELRHDSRAGWDALLLHDDEIVVVLRGFEEAQARLLARSWRENYVRSGWALHAPEQSWVVLSEDVVRTWLGPVDGTWTPEAGLITELLPRLMTILQTGLDEVNARLARFHPLTAETRARTSDYLVQCAGIVRTGRRLVVLNGFHGRKRTIEANADQWLTVPVVVMDGGWHFFRAVYDPSTQQIDAFRFNRPGVWLTTISSRSSHVD